MCPSKLRIHAGMQLWEGPGCADHLADHLAQTTTQAMALIDPTVAQTQFGQRLLIQLTETGRVSVTCQQVAPDAPISLVERVAETITGHAPEVLVAIGGGSTIDAAKAAIATASADRRLTELLEGAPLAAPRCRLVAVATTCGTGSETTPYAVVLDEAARRKRALADPRLVPRVAVLDATALVSLPAELVTATGIDALAHAVEAYLSRDATPLTRAVTLGPARRLTRALATPPDGDLARLQDQLSAAAATRMVFPQVNLTVAHAMAHPLGVHAGLHHGVAVACCLPVALEANLPAVKDLAAGLADALGVGASAGALVDWAWRTCTPVAATARSRFAGTRLDLDQLTADTLGSRNLASNPVPVTRELLTDLYRRVLEA